MRPMRELGERAKRSRSTGAGFAIIVANLTLARACGGKIHSPVLLKMPLDDKVLKRKKITRCFALPKQGATRIGLASMTNRPIRPAQIGSEPASPCVKVCEVDRSAGLCRGCGRTLAEISAWFGASAAQKHAILLAVRDRAQSVSIKST